MKKNNFTMFVVKLGTPSRANYEHSHVYLAYRRQTGTVVTRQTYDRAPRLTRPPTAHISRGDNAIGKILYFNVVRGSLFSEPCRFRIVLLDRDQHLRQAVKLN